MSDLVEWLVALESDIQYQDPAGPDQPEFRHAPGPVPVLLSAPHGAVHTRQGQVKEEDEYTAGMARLVAGMTGAHVLYARRKSPVDPNWDADAPYKLQLAEIVKAAGIRFVVDLHGAAARRPFGLALGTLSGRSCSRQLPAIVTALGAAGFSPDGQGTGRLDIDGAFTANGKTGQETVTHYAWFVLGVPAAQVEINESLRVARRRPDASAQQLHFVTPEALQRTVAGLVAMVQAVR
jgi:hypothetical protein